MAEGESSEPGREFAGVGRRRRRLTDKSSLLYQSEIRALVAGNLLSDLGSAVALLAVAYVSYRDSKSMVTTVLVAASYSVPAALVGLRAGRLAGRADRRHVMIASYLGTMVVWTGVLVLDLASLLNPYWLMLTSALAGLVGAVRFPSWQEFLRNLVPSEKLAEANGLFSSVGAVAALVGAIAGGLVITWLGEDVVFAFNVVSYVPLIAVLAMIRPPPPAIRVESPRRNVRQMIALARSSPTLRGAITLVAILSLLAVPVAQLLPAMASEFGSEAHNLGFLTAFYSLGASLVAWTLHHIRDNYPRDRLADRAALACGLSLVVVGLIGASLGDPGRRGAVIVLLVPIGLGVSMVQALLSATVQLSSSADMEGETIALYGITVSLVVPVGGLALAGVTDVSSVWIAVGAAGLLLSIVGLWLRTHRWAGAATANEGDAKRAADHHARNLSRHPPGFLQPGHFHPLTVRPRAR